METIITDKIAFGGNCLAKIGGKNVFVPFAIPGETLKVEITREKRDYSCAEIAEIIEPSPFRVKPACPLYGKCGGCNMMHIEPEFQKKLRKQILIDCLERNGITVNEDSVEVISGSSFNYRSRFQLNDGGFCERNSNCIIPVENCLCAVPEINRWFSETPFSARPKGRCHIFGSKNVFSSEGSECGKVLFSAEETKASDNYTLLKKKNKNIRCVKKRYSGTTVSEENTVRVRILDKEISFDVKGFFQSNIEVLEKSIEAVCGGLAGTSVLDMYAGCGTFSVFLAEHFKNLTLVEHNRDALVFAEKNLMGIKHQSIGLSGAKWSESNKNALFDAVVIDPPRSGMEKEVLDWLCRSQIPQIRSVSCDPATHARDLSALIKSGYVLKKLYLLDFYPNTSHIESLAVLEK